MSTNNKDIIEAYNNIITAFRSSSSKNDAIKNLKDIKISNHETKIGTKCANKIYDTYSKYTGGVGRWKK